MMSCVDKRGAVLGSVQGASRRLYRCRGAGSWTAPVRGAVGGSSRDEGMAVGVAQRDGSVRRCISCGFGPPPGGVVWIEQPAVGEDSGALSVGVAREGGLAVVNPEALELSNVELADEFTRMIMTQRAYGSSATVFKTVDEMLQVASQLKR